MRCSGVLLAAALSSGCHIIAGFDGLELREGVEPVWSERFGSELEQSVDEVVLTNGALRVAGDFEGSLGLGDTTLSAVDPARFIAQLDTNGTVEWALALDAKATAHGLVDNTPYLAISHEEAVSIAGLELAASVERHFALVELAADGQSATPVFDGTATALATFFVAEGKDPGEFAVGASYEGTFAFDGGNCATLTAADQNVVVAVVSNGNCLWQKSWGDTQAQRIDRVATDSGGNVIVAGRFLGTINFGDGLSITSSGGEDYFLVKLSPLGVVTWAKRFGDSDELQGPIQLAVRRTGTISIAGYFEGDVDFGTGIKTSSQGRDIFVAKLDPSGNTVWVNHYPVLNAPPEAEPQLVLDQLALAVDGGGNTVFAGHFRGQVDFGGRVRVSEGDLDMFIASLDVDGELNWSDGFGNTIDQCNYGDCRTALAIDSGNSIYMGGGFAGGINLGGDDLDSAGGSDAYLAKFGP